MKISFNSVELMGTILVVGLIIGVFVVYVGLCVVHVAVVGHWPQSVRVQDNAIGDLYCKPVIVNGIESTACITPSVKGDGR
jgi:hypothetical protein